MSGEKIKVKEIEGSKEEVIVFLQDSGIDIPDYLNGSKAIKVPFWSIVTTSAIFSILLCAMIFVESEKILQLLIVLSVISGFVNIGLIYMCWKNKTLAGIIALGEVIAFSLSLQIYTPKDIVKKIENTIEKVEAN